MQLIFSTNKSPQQIVQGSFHYVPIVMNYSRNLGLVRITIAGTKNSELMRQVVMEITIKAPKYFKGVKLDKINCYHGSKS